MSSNMFQLLNSSLAAFLSDGHSTDHHSKKEAAWPHATILIAPSLL